jgi:uncharacterized membrane protein YgaE (UPF0421/DUF939 family)
MAQTGTTPRADLVRRPGLLLRTWIRHPRVALAVRGALAASIAWYVAGLLPDPAGEYPYYAPLGAVVATTFTLAGSVRESFQSVAAIALGGVIAYIGGLVGVEQSPVTVAVVVALGVLATGWRLLGSMSSWVPTAALFTLVIGGGEAFFVGVYAGLVLLGAAIGIVINAVFPPLLLAPAQRAVEVVRLELAGQLSDVADALDRDEPLDAEDWERRLHEISPKRWRMRNAVQEADDARRGNRRARHYADQLDDLDRQARALDRVAMLVVDLTDVLSTEERADREEVPLGPALRRPAAEALRRLENVVRNVDRASIDDDTVLATREALADYATAVDRARTDAPGGGTMVAGSLAVTIRRCLDELLAMRAPVDRG